MVIKEILQASGEKLKKANIDNFLSEAHIIVKHFLEMDAIDMLLQKEKEIDKEDEISINDAINRRIKHEPLQYILGVQEFMGLDFNVDKSVLVPRQDTETLVEHILDEYMNKGFSALDIGTGSGCIAISLAHFNKNAYVRGIDISEKAVETARMNASKNTVGDRVKFLVCDVFKDTLYGKYDLIVSNPPYIETDVIDGLEPEVREFEPNNALDGGIDGLDYYRHIIEIAPSILFENGMLAFEVGYNQADEVKKLMKKNFKGIKIIKDLCGVKRVVSGRLK